MTADRGWCPFARQHRGYYAEGPFGYPAGTKDQNTPIMFVDHTMGGYKSTLDNDQWRHENLVGVHFGIGQDGSVDQYASIYDASWGNGVAGSIQKYDRSNKHLADLEKLGRWIEVRYAGTVAFALVRGDVNLPNSHGIVTEHEDKTVPDPVWSPEMLATDIRVKNWCIEDLQANGRTLEIDPDVLVRHSQIDAVNRAHCPGDNYPKPAILAGISREEDMKSFLCWVPGSGVHFIGPNGARYINAQATVDELGHAFGYQFGADGHVILTQALSWATVSAIGVAK